LENPKSFSEIEEAVQAEFDVDLETVRTDLQIFIEELERIGAIEEP